MELKDVFVEDSEDWRIVYDKNGNKVNSDVITAVLGENEIYYCIEDQNDNIISKSNSISSPQQGQRTEPPWPVQHRASSC